MFLLIHVHAEVIQKRKNIGKSYYDLLRIKVKGSSDLNRKIQGWIEKMYNYCRVI